MNRETYLAFRWIERHFWYVDLPPMPKVRIYDPA